MGISQWKEIDGDNTLALDWPLNENSLVWEIGGFEGRWVQQMWDKFHCNIVVFEPQIWLVDRMKVRFENNPKINIRPYGLWIHDTTLRIADYFTDGASVIKKNVRQEADGEFRKVSDEMRGSPEIDVTLMNVEGSEYYLIPEMTFSGVIAKTRFFWCQFHPGLIGNGEKRFEWICTGLDKTHRILWDHYPTAVAWDRK